MADLGDYLGHILCEVARARVMADMEAIRTAKIYVADDSKLLRNFPVPRMRLPTVEISVPVMINDIPEGYMEKTDVDGSLLGKMLADELGPALKKQDLHIAVSEINKIIKADPNLSKGQINMGLADTLSLKLHDHTRLISKKRGAAALPTSGETFEAISATIRESVKKVLSEIPRQPMGIAIESRTSSVREVKDPQLLFNIKLTITEEALDIHLESNKKAAALEGEKVQPAAPTLTNGPDTPQIIRLVPE
jgi:hypothetical protein